MVDLMQMQTNNEMKMGKRMPAQKRVSNDTHYQRSNMSNDIITHSPITGQHHSFDIGLAAKYGIEGAILIHHFQHWIGVNQRLGKNFKEGRTWTYQTKEEILAHFPYFTYNVVRRELEKLIKKGVLIKNNFNKRSYDKTLWYAFANEKVFMPDTDSNKDYERQKRPSMGKNACAMGENARPIPDTIPNTISIKGSKISRPVVAHPPKYAVNPTPSPLKEKIEYRPKVFFTEADYKIAETTHGAPKLNGILDILSSRLAKKEYNYKLDTIMPGGWACKAYEEANRDSPKPQPIEKAEGSESNRQWFKHIMKCIIAKTRGESYYLNYNYINFRNLDTNEEGGKIFFDDPKFKNLIYSELRKRDYVKA